MGRSGAGGTGKGRPTAQERLILDAGAVLALSRLDPRALAFVVETRRLGGVVHVPVVVVAETSRGGGPRDARVNRVLKSMVVPPTTEAVGRTAGRLLARADSSATADALVVAEAVVGGGGRILTGDPDDLGVLAAEHPEVLIQPL